MQREFIYYWVINPVKSNIKTFSVSGFSVFNADNVISGNTELGAEGRVFFDHCHRTVSLYDHSLWIFSDECFATQDQANHFSRILRVISEAIYDFKISRPGFIIKNKNTDQYITKQPPQLENFDSVYLNDIGEDEIKRLFDLCRAVIALDIENCRYYESIFDYLRDIRLSPRFVGELALWSFLEHHWAKDKAKTDVHSSLKCLLALVFDDRKDRSDFNKAIKSIGKDLGREYDEKILRNILAHGKHFTLSEKWTEDNWTNFYMVHEKLYSLVVRGIEIEIAHKK